MKILNESIVNISDDDIKSYIADSLRVYKMMFPKYSAKLDKIPIYEDNLGWNTFGNYEKPTPYEYLNGMSLGEITLNTNMYGNSENEIRSTILHEIGHFIDFMEQQRAGEIFQLPEAPDDEWGVYDDGWKPHGKSWRSVVDRISSFTGIPITVKGSEPLRAKDGSTQPVRYLFRCNKCGEEIPMQRASSFVQNYQNYHCGNIVNGQECGGKYERIK